MAWAQWRSCGGRVSARPLSGAGKRGFMDEGVERGPRRMSTLQKAANREVRPETGIVVVSLFACRGLPRDVLRLVLCTLNPSDRVARLTPAIASNAARPRLCPPNSILPDRLDGGFYHNKNSMPLRRCSAHSVSITIKTGLSHPIVSPARNRPGSPFSVGAISAIDTVEISGRAMVKFFTFGDGVNRLRISYFPTCGSTISWKPRCAAISDRRSRWCVGHP